MLVLSLFPGADLLGRAFREEGFCVVKGPDLIFGEDIRGWSPPGGVFHGVIGGVPCQFWSALANIVRANGYEPRHGDLFPEFQRVVSEAAPDWFLSECAPGSPTPCVRGYSVVSFLWNNAWLGEEQRRVRRFSFGVKGKDPVELRQWMPQAALELPNAAPCVASRGSECMVKLGGSGKVKSTYQKHTVTGNSGGRRATADANGRSRGCQGDSDHQRLAPRKGRLIGAIRLQGLEEGFLDDTPFTAQGKLQVVANGVPLPLGRAVAKAVRAAFQAAAEEGDRGTT